MQPGIDYQAAWYGRIPRAGTTVGDQVRDGFVREALDLFGDTRFLWLPKKADTTTHTEESRHAATVTYDATMAAAKSLLGSGIAYDFDASADEGDAPDSDNYSFGDGAVDQPFSVVALVYADDATPAADATILSKWDEDTDAELREWRVLLSATNGYPRIELYDESADAYIGREDQTALTVSSWTLLGFTYDGSGANTGLNVYVDAAQLDDANSSSGTYVAMENTATKLLLAHNLSAAATPVPEGFWDGKLALVAIVGRELDVNDNWELKKMVNSFFDLTL